MNARAVVALGLVAVISLLGCGEKKKNDQPAPRDPVPASIKGSSGAPANWTCVGGADQFVGTSSTSTNVFVGVLPLLGAPPPKPDVTVSRLDPSDGTTVVGSPSTPTDANGLTTLDMGDDQLNALMFETSDTTIAPTTYFNYPHLTGTTDEEFTVIPTQVRDGLPGFYDIEATTLAGMGQGTGAVVDCDGDEVGNAVVEVEGTVQRVGYLTLGTPDSNAVSTGSDGLFVALGIPPTSGAPVRFTVWVYDGADSEGVPESEVAQAYGHLYADGVTVLVLLPIPGS